MDNIDELIKKARKVYAENFPPETCFERAVFFSWGCTIGNCAFCYMSTQPENKKPKETKRSKESILAEFILCKHLGWDIGFFTGGIGVLDEDELEFLLKAILEIISEKIWLSVGPVSKKNIERFLPYIKGIVGSTETINPELHRKVCPSKPLLPYEKMFISAGELKLKKAMTFIVGMGEKRSDLEILSEFIEKYKIDKIHVYGLIPQKGTIFAESLPPSKEEQAWWIANLRIRFPKLDIQCGIWEDRVENVSYLLKAGANSVSKFKALKLFGSKEAKSIEQQAKLAGRKFNGTLIIIPDIDWNAEVNKLSFDQELKRKIKLKLNQYLEVMNGKRKIKED